MTLSWGYECVMGMHAGWLLQPVGQMVLSVGRVPNLGFVQGAMNVSLSMPLIMMVAIREYDQNPLAPGPRKMIGKQTI